MQIVNEVSEVYLESLKNKAVEEYRKRKRENFFHLIKILAFCFVIVLSCSGLLAYTLYMLKGIHIGALSLAHFWILSLFSIIVGCVIGGVMCAVDAGRNIRAWKKPLTDSDKEKIYLENLNISRISFGLYIYANLKEAEILDWKLGNSEILISYVKKDDFVEKINVILEDVKIKRGIEKPILTLTNKGFVFCKPHAVLDLKE